MPHFDHIGAQKILQLIKTTVSVSLLIAVFYTLQYIFGMQFVCCCRADQHRNTVLYMAVPPLILTLVINLIEPFHRKKIFPTCSSWRLCCKCCSSFNNFCGHVLKLVTLYFGLGAVWMSVVLYEGNWYYCLKTNLNISQTGLPCKENLTYNEQRIKDAYKADSHNIGFGVICGFLFLWSLSEIRRAYCRKDKETENSNSCKWYNCCSWFNCCKCPPYYYVVYDEILAEQVSNHLNSELEAIAKERAKQICKPYLDDIKKTELKLNDSAQQGDKGSDPWQKISAFNFYMEKPTRISASRAQTANPTGTAGHTTGTSCEATEMEAFL